jgi:hypothetical protein
MSEKERDAAIAVVVEAEYDKQQNEIAAHNLLWSVSSAVYAGYDAGREAERREIADEREAIEAVLQELAAFREMFVSVSSIDGPIKGGVSEWWIRAAGDAWSWGRDREWLGTNAVVPSVLEAFNAIQGKPDSPAAIPVTVHATIGGMIKPLPVDEEEIEYDSPAASSVCECGQRQVKHYEGWGGCPVSRCGGYRPKGQGQEEHDEQH